MRPTKKSPIAALVSIVLSATTVSAASVTASSGNVDLTKLALLGTPAHDVLDTESGAVPTFLLFEEQTRALTALDITTINSNNNSALVTASAADGDTATSFLFAMGKGRTSSQGSVTFTGRILAIFTSAGYKGAVQALQNTDKPFGLAGVDYQQAGSPQNRGTLEQSTESMTVSGNTVSWDQLNGGLNGLEHFRVLVETAPVPVPASLPLLLAGIAGIGAMAKRRSKADA